MMKHNLLPWPDDNDHEIINWYSLNDDKKEEKPPFNFDEAYKTYIKNNHGKRLISKSVFMEIIKMGYAMGKMNYE